MGKIVTETKETLQEDSYFISKDEIIHFLTKGTPKSEYENLTSITKEEIDELYKAKDLINHFLPYIKEYKETLLQENVEF